MVVRGENFTWRSDPARKPHLVQLWKWCKINSYILRDPTRSVHASASPDRLATALLLWAAVQLYA